MPSSFVPGEEPEEPTLSESDMEFLRSLSVKPEEPETWSFFERTVEQMRSFLPKSKKSDPEVERIALIVLTECITRGLFLAELQPTEPQAEPASAQTTGSGMHISLEIGSSLEARFKDSWNYMECSLERTLQVELGDFATMAMRFVSASEPIPYVAHSEEDEISVYIDGTLRGGARIPVFVNDKSSFARCIDTLVVSLVGEYFRPDVAARQLEMVRETCPHTLLSLEACGWETGAFYRLFKTILSRGLGLCPIFLAEVLAKLSTLSQMATSQELEFILERVQFFANCPYGYGATTLKALELSEQSIEKLEKATRIQDLVELEQLRSDRMQHRRIVLVPPALCRKARLLFGLWGVAVRSAIPEDFQIQITGKL